MPDGKQVRKNVQTFHEALRVKEELELKARGQPVEFVLHKTRLTQDELAEAEHAIRTKAYKEEMQRKQEAERRALPDSGREYLEAVLARLATIDAGNGIRTKSVSEFGLGTRGGGRT